MTTDTVREELSQFVWDTRYRDPGAHPPEQSVEDTWNRVASAVAAIERDPQLWTQRFLGILRGFRFLPGGRILAGAGTSRQVTLCNCFVMGAIEDSVEGIFESLKEGALTMQQGGGVGYDFSTLRPHGSRAHSTGTIASGPVSFMRVWDAMCATILGMGARRGAMMATLRCDHPDIEQFIDAKRAPDALRHFNLSVLITDAFMKAVETDSEWPLVFPLPESTDASERVGCVDRVWSGSTLSRPCRVYKTVRARSLWNRLCESAYDCAEPGVLFVDRINAANNLSYIETISATNPCGEEPLPPYGACNLGSINLTAFVNHPFTTEAALDLEAVRITAQIAVRFLDNVIDISRFPLMRQRERAHQSRRLGLGVTGLADALAMLTLRYDSEAARKEGARAMMTIRDAAYQASAELAREKGSFPSFNKEAYLERPFIRNLPAELQANIKLYGLRNSHLTAIAPAGTISLLARGVSSGIEPIFYIEAVRRVLKQDGKYQSFHTTDYAYALWRVARAPSVELPPFFLDSGNISPHDQILMQAALQPYIDGAISKTVTLPKHYPKSETPKLLESAYALGLKGCTLYRIETRTAVVFDRYDTDPARESARGAHCCDVDRESD
jgi:ribonucleoside-diphosphate reductase alpha chain